MLFAHGSRMAPSDTRDAFKPVLIGVTIPSTSVHAVETSEGLPILERSH